MYQAFLGQWLSEFWLLFFFFGTILYKYQQANQSTESVNVYVIQDYLSEGESETHVVSGVKSLPPWAPCGGGRLNVPQIILSENPCCTPGPQLFAAVFHFSLYAGELMALT